ncbi:MAG: Holliday junction resolvase RuvX [Planctomycetaceae bacterium]
MPADHQPPAGSASTPDELGGPLPTDGRLMGIDFGTRRIGLAVSTPEQSFSAPLDVLYRTTPAVEARELRELVEDYRIVGFVIGLPLHVSGDESSVSYKARLFGAWLHETCQRPVRFWDERYSSSVADDWLAESGLTRDNRKANRDRLSAYVILQSYLERQRADRQVESSPDPQAIDDVDDFDADEPE